MWGVVDEVSTGRAGGLHRGLWVGAGVFLLGLVGGSAGTALLVSGSGPSALEQAESAQAAPGPGPTRAGVLVTDACLRALNDAEDALAAIDDAAQAAAEVNAARLDEVVRRLQPVQDRLQTDLGGCEAVAQRPEGGATASSDEPLPGLSPTGGETGASPSPTEASTSR